MMRRLFLAPGHLGQPLLAVLVLCGCDSKAQTVSPAEVVGTTTVFEPGQTAETAHFAVLVHGAKRCAVEPHFQPPSGVQKLGVEVTISGRSGLAVPINPFYALLTDDKGERFEATLVGCTPQLKASRVANGQSSRGWATFDVPETSRGLKFSYSPTVIGAGRQEVRFAIDP